LTILRPEGPLFFANADHVLRRVREESRRATPPRQILLNLGASPTLGVGTNDLLAQIHDELTRAGVELSLARASAKVRALLERSGLLARLGPERVFDSQNDAVEAYLRQHPDAAREDRAERPR
jgi:MFS superfamily sulfate permease-like transporter